MPRPTFLSSPALSALKFTPQEKSAARLGSDESTDERREPTGKILGSRQILEIVDRFYRAKVLADAVASHVPHLRERVCIEGRDEVFAVIYVDQGASVADLVSTERVGELLESVPFSAIYPAEPRAA